MGANYTKGMRYGSNSTVNVAISPQFLSKMAKDPKLEKEYEENIAAMQECDEQNARQVAAGGWHVVAQGWAIDKDGGISKWSIVQKDGKKSYLQTMFENADKIRRKNEEKKHMDLKV
ncbi:MAG: foldase [Lachnospiraceae bacterium]|nr:foldase [Lachnospiraceae bacterium]